MMRSYATAKPDVCDSSSQHKLNFVGRVALDERVHNNDERRQRRRGRLRFRRRCLLLYLLCRHRFAHPLARSKYELLPLVDDRMLRNVRLRAHRLTDGCAQHVAVAAAAAAATKAMAAQRQRQLQARELHGNRADKGARRLALAAAAQEEEAGIEAAGVEALVEGSDRATAVPAMQARFS
jgi:hypothetical protein